MDEAEKITVTCSHCGKVISCKAPSKPGRYSLTCKNPECGQKVVFQYPAPAPAPAPSKPAVEYGILEDGSYRFKCANASCGCSALVPSQMVKVGHNVVFCTKCKTKHEFDVEPTEEDLLKCQTAGCESQLDKPEGGDGIYRAVCSKCNSEYTIVVKDGKVAKVTKKTQQQVSTAKKVILKLVAGTFLSKKEYILSKGSHYVGRQDESNISDFSIKDKYASSRSVRIDVNENGGSLVYRMTIEKATNPVYHNNSELVKGDIVYLTSGDTLKLGKTLIKIQKVDNKK